MIARRREFYRRATLFADGAKGMRMQSHDIVERRDGGEPINTGIVEAAKKDNHKAPWVVTVTYEGATYLDVLAAIAAYEAKVPWPIEETGNAESLPA